MNRVVPVMIAALWVLAGWTMLARGEPIAGEETPAGVESLPTGGFAFTQRLVLPVDPEIAYDYLTGDISGWWDHSYSEQPLKLYIDARPGGGFYEIFDEQGNGVQHAVVIFAQRGKRLTLRGPLGLSGNALDMVFNFEFQSDAAGTEIVMQARAAGQLDPGWPESVAGVWHHFLVERLLPYAERDCREKAVCVGTR
jgi:hypothetical protein